ncbi:MULTISPECIES: hypothetical protein [Acetobacter]|jgi:hypothetical protein|uniref:Uncharacterized protein n=1 Tax=Acetobacter lovaniensis TaxID=104100 RepID=A0A841QI52_9PROT|nr:hypothetical protein [Acetobacter lovaniensis]MBB6457687.1 hypothetical protein [Acetobacter lovaniensis]MCI1794809.1 hypothetical protein [Acetobacter lovaniensis]MCP1239956.1 hypothetical protein [Acetobacter lovaniensis]NHN81970.1 hypothetical protein [Acetobacter lovaniensis]
MFTGHTSFDADQHAPSMQVDNRQPEKQERHQNDNGQEKLPERPVSLTQQADTRPE